MPNPLYGFILFCIVAALTLGAMVYKLSIFWRASRPLSKEEMEELDRIMKPLHDYIKLAIQEGKEKEQREKDLMFSNYENTATWD